MAKLGMFFKTLGMKIATLWKTTTWFKIASVGGAVVIATSAVVIPNAVISETGGIFHKCDFSIESIDTEYSYSVASCTEKAKYYYSCACGEKGTDLFEYGNPLGHDLTHHASKQVTCTDVGYDEYDTCSRCDYSTYEEIPATGHTNSEWITDAEATCTEDGSKHQICSVCNDTIETAIIPATGHTDGEWITDTEATCTKDGSKHQLCSVCNDTIKTTIVPATGHSGGIATCTEAPICSICNNSYNKPLGHTQGGIICSRCNNYTITLYEIGKSYTEKDGLTITLNSYTITEYEGYYAYTVNYTIKNEVQNSKKLPGTFKLFFADGTGENQYGAFNYLYYGDSTTRTYTWKVLKNQTVLILEYNADSQDGFFRDTPSKNSLHWLPSNKENN